MTSPIVITYILIWVRFTNECHSTTIGTIGLPRLARALLTLIGSCRIYYVFNIKARFPVSILFLQSLCLGKSLIITNITPNMQVESSATPLLTVDEVEKVQRQRVASLIGHVFQLTYAATVDKLIQEQKLNRCHGCAIQHPSQNQHSCLVMDNDDAWIYYHDEVVEQIDLNVILKTAESVCSALGFKLGKTWEAYVTELPKLPWTNIYLTSLELEDYGELEDRILYAIYYGPCGLKCKDPNAVEIDSQVEVQCPERVVRKDEQPMDLDLIINDIQNKLCF